MVCLGRGSYESRRKEKKAWKVGWWPLSRVLLGTLSNPSKRFLFDLERELDVSWLEARRGEARWGEVRGVELNCTGLDWIGLDWIGSNGMELDWIGFEGAGRYTLQVLLLLFLAITMMINHPRYTSTDSASPLPLARFLLPCPFRVRWTRIYCIQPFPNPFAPDERARVYVWWTICRGEGAWSMEYGVWEYGS